jgi:RsmE family RNA methyltransferase
MNLILLAGTEVDASGVARVTGDRARHMREVLHAGPGQTVRIGLVDGPIGVGTVTAVADDGVALRCAFDDAVPAPPRVDLLLAVPRPKVLRRLWAQLSAIGVGRIMLTNAERVERNYFDTHWLSPQTYGPLLIEGLQQARDTRVPRVSVHREFRPFVEDELSALVPDTCRVVAHPEDAPSIAKVVASGGRDRVVLAIGPEGGWNGFELERLAAAGFVRASMGPRTLRVDTACVAALAMAHEGLVASKRRA